MNLKHAELYFYNIFKIFIQNSFNFHSQPYIEQPYLKSQLSELKNLLSYFS